LSINEATPGSAPRVDHVRLGCEIDAAFDGFTAPQATKGVRWA
jgi:hypothetical protein